jgi:hypothetical protein
VIEKPPGSGDGPIEPVSGVTSPRGLSLERFPIRTRESGATLSAWRLVVICEEGLGAIVGVEGAPEEQIYRGEGVFLGWSQDRLAAAYGALRPSSEETDFGVQQLG